MEKAKFLFIKYKEIILYIFFGGLTTCVNWVSYLILVNILGGADSTSAVLWATILAQVLSIVFAYITNRKWVFESKAKGVKEITAEMSKFFACRGASIFLDMGLMYLGVSILKYNDALIKLLSNIVIIVVNYVFSKLFVFRKKTI